MKQIITPELLSKSMTYPEYKGMLDALLEEGRTTGPNQSEAMINFGRLNQKRMKKWDKIGKILPDLITKLQDIYRPMTWLVLTEGWCGDAAQNLPFISKMALECAVIDLKLILRDENPRVMDQFLTNGGRSIPKLIALDTQSLEVLGTWGPRPKPMQMLAMENKEAKTKTYDELNQEMHLWYAKDKGLTLQLEFLAILDVWNKKQQSLPVLAV